MKPNTILQSSRLFCLSCAFAVAALVPTGDVTAQNKKATEKEAKTQKAKDFDDVLKELQKAEAEVQKAMKEIDWSRLEQELKASMQKMDVEMANAHATLQKELKEIDTDKLKKEIDKAVQELKAVDVSKIKAEVEASLAKIDTEKIKLELEKVKEVDFEKIKVELEKVKPALEQSMQQAKESLEKAKVEIKEYQTFVNTLETEGLINKKEGYTIEIKENSLVINGKEQPAAVYNKHRAFLEKHKGTTIKKTDSDLNINKN